MQSLRDIAPYLALGAAALDVVLLVFVVRLVAGQRRLRHAQLAVLGAHGERDLVAHAQNLEEQVRNLRDAVQGLDGLLAGYKTDLDRAFTHRAIVRYDAFRDIGGEQSASIALLDNTASGLVISMIHSRDYARIYVKQLRRSVPDRALSPEEVDVVEQALAMRAGTPAADMGKSAASAGAGHRAAASASRPATAASAPPAAAASAGRPAAPPSAPPAAPPNAPPAAPSGAPPAAPSGTSRAAPPSAPPADEPPQPWEPA